VGDEVGMKVLLSGVYHPTGLLLSFERALRKIASVTYCGLPFGFERAGRAPDVDLGQIPTQQRPDWFLYIFEWRSVFPTGLEKVSFPTVAYFPDACFDITKVLNMIPFFDYVFVWNRRLVNRLRKVNPQTAFLPLGYDPERMPRVFTNEKLYDVASVGGIDYPKRKMTMTRAAARFRTNNWQARNVSHRQIAWEYSHSKIVFHCLPAGMPPGMDDDSTRVFEGMGCGSLMVTETCEGRSSSIFTPGKHLVTYGPRDDPLEAMEHYLKHEPERARIAEEGYREVMARHTYTHRVENILEVLRADNFRLQAPVRGKNASQVFLAYQKNFSHFMMLDSMAKLFAQDGFSFVTRVRGLFYVGAAVRRRLRQMAWRKTAGSFLGAFRNTNRW
jgi:glycosyl transferase family 1